MHPFLSTLLFLILLSVPTASFAQDTIFAGDDSSAMDINFELILAAERGDADWVLRLLEKGADVNAVTADGISALMYASQNGHLKVVQTLVVNGAKIDYNPLYEPPALIGATKFNRETIAELLLRKGALPDITDENQATSLMYAAGYGYFILTDMLLFYKSDINKTDLDGNTPLMYSTYNGYSFIDSLLLAKGADATIPDKKGFTPLMVAAQSGNLEIVTLLLKHGCKPEVSNDYGETAVSLALRNNQQEVLTQLLEASDVIRKKDIPRSILLQSNADTKSLMKKHGFRQGLLPCFNQLTFGHGILFTTNDFLFSFQTSLNDIRYKAAIKLEFSSRFWAKRITKELFEGYTYQLWARRSVWSLTFEKQILFGGDLRKCHGLVVTVGENYTYGKFRGTDTRPDPLIVTSPGMGYFWKNRGTYASIRYQYLDLKETGTSPHRLSLEFRIGINLKRSSAHYNKQIPWL